MPWRHPDGTGFGGGALNSTFTAMWIQISSFTANGTSDDITTEVEAAASNTTERNSADGLGILSTGTASGDTSSTAIQNYSVQLRNSSTGEPIDDGLNREVTGVLSKSGAVWTINYYKSTGASHTFSSEDIDLLVAEVFSLATMPSLGHLHSSVFTDVVGTGNVVGPSSSTDNAIALFDGTTGKLLKNSVVTIDGSGNLTGLADLTLTGSLDVSAGSLLLPQGTTPAPTAEGSLAWDTDDDLLRVGTGSSTLTLVDTSSTQTLTNKTLTTPTIADFTNANHDHQDAAGGGQLDHGLALTGLGDDDHPQYALLAGRSGGQTLLGGTGAGDDLTLGSTSNATKGNVFVASGTVLGLPSDGLLLQQSTANYTVSWDDPSATRALTIPDPGGDDSFVFADATQTLTNKTISGGSVSPTTLTFPSATAPSQTAEGQVVWDSDDDVLTVGTGTGRVTLVNTTDLSAYLKVDGTTAGATTQAQDFGTNGVTTDVIAESTSSNGVVLNGTRHYADSATDPSSPAPAEGDRYYNTTLEMEMRYDGSRSKWLSVEVAEVWFGRGGTTGDGAYYRGPDGKSYKSTRGRYAEFKGTVVSLTYTRKNTTAVTFEVTADGTTISTVASAATSGSDTTLNDNFAAGAILGVRNQTGGNDTKDVMGWVRVKWRA